MKEVKLLGEWRDILDIMLYSKAKPLQDMDTIFAKRRQNKLPSNIREIKKEEQPGETQTAPNPITTINCITKITLQLSRLRCYNPRQFFYWPTYDHILPSSLQ